MDVDPMEAVEQDDDKERSAGEKRRSRLNNWVAVTVALLATFMGICKVKDDNIVQGMQQAQADKIDNYAWYQSRNVREEVLRSTAIQLEAQASAAPAQAKSVFQTKAAQLYRLADEQKTKKEQQKHDADEADKTYNKLNYHDDQFDLSDALMAIAISLLALTALTQKRWLFAVALLPTFFGILMGLAGLLGWRIHSDLLAKLLS